MRHSLFGIGFILSLCISSCGIDDSGDNDDPGEEAKENTLALINGVSLMGTWEGDCQDTDLIDRSLELEYKFSGDDVEKTYNIYEDSDCDDRLAIIKYSGETNISRVEDKEDYRNLDLEYKKIRARVMDDDAAEFFSRINFCGISDWEKDKEYHLTDESRRDDCPLPDAPATDYERVKIEDDRLYFGNPGLEFATKKADRPKEVNKDEPFEKEK